MAQISLGDPVKKRREFATKIAHRQAYSYLYPAGISIYILYMSNHLFAPRRSGAVW